MDDEILLPAEHKNLWGPYREYFITKRQNYLAVIRDLPELWNCFEAWNIMRGSIDTAMVAHRIFREPKLLVVWVRKNDGGAAKNAYAEAFKSANLFPAEYGLSELKSFYGNYSERGTHPGPAAISMHINIEERATGQDWNHTYLETNPKRTAASLFRMLEASALVEGACFQCFEDRLKLDPELMDMRARFGICKKGAAWVVHNQILKA